MDVKVQLVRPAFLSKENKHIASLTLESIGPVLLQEQIITVSELQALLFELKTFETQKENMITLPGIYQAWGYKK